MSIYQIKKTVSFTLRAIKPPSKSETVTARIFRSINMEAFTQDITTCLANDEISTSIPKFNDRVKWYDTILSALIDKHAPVKNIHIRPRVPGMNNDIMVVKRLKRNYERRWRFFKLNFDKATYKKQKKKYDLILKEARTMYMSNLVLENAGNPKSLFKLIGSFLNKPMKNPLPEHTSDQQLAEEFKTYFTDKTLHIHNNLNGIKYRNYQTKLDCLEQVSENYLSSIMKSSPKKCCPLDPIPTWLLVKCEPFVLPTITSSINSSITLSYVPSPMKSAIINPQLKKLNLAILPKNYRPVSNLKYLSKLIERVIAQM